MTFSDRYRQEENVWLPNEKYNFRYSDGDDSENYILEAIRQSNDLSTGSAELFACIRDWPSLYHLSPKRADLLRPLSENLSGKKILEIGSGCGAITRFLGELNGDVLALEGSMRRARITRERCRDLENVTVVADNFDDFETAEKFDCITLIGVLEYANLFIKGDDPFLVMLQRARHLLQPGGFIIIAIENKLGLKYLAGAPEDHLGLAFSGIENRYTSDTASTFGKNELTTLLHQAGLNHTGFLYPYPDYKLPVTIVTDRGLQVPAFDIPALLLEKHEYVQGQVYNSVFNSSLAERAIFANGLTADLANSFLIVAAPESDVNTDTTLLATSYSTLRKKPYCKSVEFRSAENGSVVINKKKLYTDTDEGSAISLVLESEEYGPGVLMLEKLVQIISVKNWNLGQLTDWAREYYNILEKNAKNVDEKYFLDGKYLDLTPFNIITLENGEFFLIDQEWNAGERLSLDYLFFRGIYYSLGQIVFYSIPDPATPRCLLDLSIAILGNFRQLDPCMLDEFREQEKMYFSSVWLQNYKPFMPQPMRIRQHELFSVNDQPDLATGYIINNQPNYLQPLPFIHSQVFWSQGDEGFNEAGSLSEFLPLTTSESSHLLKVEQTLSAVKKIRLDPANHPGVFYLHSISIVGSDGIIIDWAAILQECVFHNLVLIRSSIKENTFIVISLTEDPIIEFQIPGAAAITAADRFNLAISVSTMDQATIVKELDNLTDTELRRGAKGGLYGFYNTLELQIGELENQSAEWQHQRKEMIHELAAKEEIIKVARKEASEKDKLLAALQKKLNQYEQGSILSMLKNRLSNSKKSG